MWTTFFTVKIFSSTKTRVLFFFLIFVFLFVPFFFFFSKHHLWQWEKFKKKKKEKRVMFVKQLKHCDTWSKREKKNKRLSVGHVNARGYSMHRYRVAFLLVYKSDETRRFPRSQSRAHALNDPHSWFFFFFKHRWSGGGGRVGGEGMPGVSSTSPSPHTLPPSLKRQHIESSVLSFSSLKQLFGRERENKNENLQTFT